MQLIRQMSVEFTHCLLFIREKEVIQERKEFLGSLWVLEPVFVVSFNIVTTDFWAVFGNNLERQLHCLLYFSLTRVKLEIQEKEEIRVHLWVWNSLVLLPKKSGKSHPLFDTWVWGSLSTSEQLENSDSLHLFILRTADRSESECDMI